MSDRSVAIKGGFWTTISTVVTMLTQMLRLIILTRFLEKSDFGVVAITNTVITLCLTFTDLGFASVIMYKKDLTKEEYSSLYWIQTILFLLIFILLVITSPYVANYYNENILTSLIVISGLSVVGQAIGKLYDSVLLKAYLFKTLAYRNIVTSVISLLVAWLMAAQGYGVLSLVYSTLIQIILLNIWNIVSGYRLQPLVLCLKIKLIMPLIRIGLYQTGTHILDFISNKIDVVIIGKLLGMDVLGVYDLAKELVIKFTSLIRTVVSKVALPIIANNNDNDKAVIERFLTVTKVVAYLCTPICITLAVFSEPVVKILYGDKFQDAIPIVSLFAVGTIISSLTSFFDMLGVAKGRTDLNFLQTVSRIILTTPVVIITSYISVLAVVWGQLAIGVVTTCLFWYIVVMHTYPMSVKKYFSQFDTMLISFSIVGIFVACLKFPRVITFSESWIINNSLYFIVYCILILLAAYLFMRKDIAVLSSYVYNRKMER